MSGKEYFKESLYESMSEKDLMILAKSMKQVEEPEDTEENN